MAPIHHVMAHFPVGLLLVALLVMIARSFSSAESVRQVERALPLLLVIGLLGGLATFVTGLLIWPVEAITSSPVARNKILIAAWALACWTVVAAVRLRGGPEVWDRGGRGPLLVMGLVGGSLLATTGALGGYLLGSPSVFSDGLRALGWDITHTLFAPTWVLGLTVLLAVLIVLLGLRRPPAPS